MRRIPTKSYDSVIELLEEIIDISNERISELTGVSSSAVRNIRNDVLEAVDFVF